LGFSYIEKNASDMRSKRSLSEALGAAVNSRTLLDFFGKLFTLDLFHARVASFTNTNMSQSVVKFRNL